MLLLYLLILIASIFSTAFGLSSFLLIPLFTLFFSTKESVAAASLYFTFQNTVKLAFFWRFTDWKISRKLLLYALPGTIAGSALLLHINVSYFQKALGLIILIYIANDLLKKEKEISNPINVKPYQLPIFGFLYGFFSGAIGSGNLLKGPLFSSVGLTKETYIATYAATSFLLNIPKVAMYVIGGLINMDVFLKSTPLLIIAILGTYIGKKFIDRISASNFTVLIKLLFVISAITLML
jgi:uncharacterized membrane protein YfcA